MFYGKAYNMVVNTLIALGAQIGIRQIDLGDRVRVRYTGNEDHFSNQGRIGIVRDIVLTPEAMELNTVYLLNYIVEDRNGELFDALRLRLDKLD